MFPNSERPCKVSACISRIAREGCMCVCVCVCVCVYVCVCVCTCARVFPEKRFLFSQVEGGTEFVTVKNLVFICRSEFTPLPTVDKVLLFLSQLLHLEDNHTYFSRLI